MTTAKTTDEKAARYDEAVRALDGRLGGCDEDEIVIACEEYVAAEDHLGDTFDTDDYRLSDAVGSLMDWWTLTEPIRAADLEPEEVVEELARARGAIEWATGMGYLGPLTPQDVAASPETARFLHDVVAKHGAPQPVAQLELLQKQWRSLYLGLGGDPAGDAKLTAEQALALLEGFGFRLAPPCAICEESGGDGFVEGDRWVHTACFDADGDDVEPTGVHEIAEPWEEAAAEPSASVIELASGDAANGPGAAADEEPAALGRAIVDLVEQVRRLRRNPCPTMQFGFSEAELRAAAIREIEELAEATDLGSRCGESGDVLGIAVNLCHAVAGSNGVLGIVEQLVRKLTFRLDHIEAGGTWVSAKESERLE